MPARPPTQPQDRLRNIYFARLARDPVMAVAELGEVYKLDGLLRTLEHVAYLNETALKAGNRLLDKGKSPYHALVVSKMVLDRHGTRPGQYNDALSLGQRAINRYLKSEDASILEEATRWSGDLFLASGENQELHNNFAKQYRTACARLDMFRNNHGPVTEQPVFFATEADRSGARLASEKMRAFNDVRPDSVLGTLVAYIRAPAAP